MLVGKQCEGCVEFYKVDSCYAKWVRTGGKCFDEIGREPTIDTYGNCRGCVGESDDILCKIRKTANIPDGCYLTKTKVEEPMSKDSDSSDNHGGSTHYYELPLNATQLQDLIEYKKMNFAMGNCFKANYRIDDPDHDPIRELNKIIWFAGREKKRRLALIDKEKGD